MDNNITDGWYFIVMFCAVVFQHYVSLSFQWAFWLNIYNRKSVYFGMCLSMLKIISYVIRYIMYKI